MNKKFFFVFFLLFAMFVGRLNAHQGKKGPKKQMPRYDLWIQCGPLAVSRQILHDSMHIFKKYPGAVVAAVGTVFGTIVYGDEIKKWFDKKENKNIVFGAGLLGLLLAYVNKKKIIKCIPEQEEELSLLGEPIGVGSEGGGGDSGLAKMAQCNVRIMRPGQIKVSFKDVAGLQTAKEDLDDILMFLKSPKTFSEMGAKVPKGVLLSGSPGNGKTLLAKALAGEVQCPFLHVNASEFIEAIVGIGAGRIRHLFAIAKELAPCIIFIDEIDAIGKKRSAHGFGGGDSEMTQTLNQLLAEMDGFETHKNPIIVIGATNRVDVLDQALTRPGRFDRKIGINAPFIKDRCKILQLHLQNVKAADNIDVYKIARGTPRFSGAELAHLINEAAILAVREAAPSVTMLHIDTARDYILYGRETQGMDITQEEYWETAIHEAGHAITRVFQEDAMPLHKVTIVPRGGALGITFGMAEREKLSQYAQEMLAEIVVMLGGSVAEEMMFGGRGAGASNDLEKARSVAMHMVMRYGMSEEFKDVSFAEYMDAQVHLPAEIATKLQEEVAKIIAQCRKIAVDILLKHKKELEQLVDMLLEEGTVYGRDVYKMCGLQEPDIAYNLAE